MLKVKWLVLLLVAIGMGYFVYVQTKDTGSTVDKNTVDSGSSILDRHIQAFESAKQKLTGDKLELAEKLLPKQATSVDLSDIELESLQVQSDAKKAEIEELMIQLDGNLHDSEARKQIKAQLKQKMDEYNKLVLPLALKSMENNNQPKT